MKSLNKIPYLILSLLFLQILLISSSQSAKANINIPDNFYKKLDLDQIYTYNVTEFNTTKPLEWADVDWFAPTKGFVNITPGGQLKINFTGFYDKDPNDFFNLFESPIPYMNCEFIENRSGTLVTNTTLLNVSNGEAALNLLLGYNTFKSGFLIPISDFNNLTLEAIAQDEPPFMNATVTVQESSNTISFHFKQKTSLQQDTKCVYDKVSGLLTYTNTSFGNYTLEMTLINPPNIPSENPTIPSFQVYIIWGIFTIVSIKYIIRLKKGKH
ncbi:MAG: hypothetical protein ACFFCC_09150 [Promethearchaeota archaeon]